VLDLVCADAAPPMVVVTGWPGTGRSTLLGKIARRLRSRGRTVIETRVAFDGVLLDRQEEGPAPRRARGPARFGPVQGAAETPLTARRAAAATAPSLTSRDAVLLIDDAQWLDADTIAVLEALAHRLAGTVVRCVCAVAVPAPVPAATAGVAALRRLRAARLATTIRIPPLEVNGTARLVQEVVGAVPAPELVTHVHDLSRGVAAAAVDAVSTLQRAGGVRQVLGHAYLVPGTSHDPTDRDTDRDTDRRTAAAHVEHVRRLGPAVLRSACAAAALEPAGPALPALLATALETTPDAALARLLDLKAAGIVHRGRDGAWRFVVPMLAGRLRATLGPFERRMLATLVVRAAWREEARLDAAELADLVAVAGRLLPAERAHAALVAAAEAAPAGPPLRVGRWWRAAADLPVAEEHRLRARLEHTWACKRAGDAAAAIAGARGLLEDGTGLPEPTRHQLFVTLVLALHIKGDLDALDAVADGTALWDGDEAVRAICRVVALALRGRWGSAYSLLIRARPIWAARPVTREWGELIHSVGELFAGRVAGFEAGLVVDPVADPAEAAVRRMRASWGIASMVALGDVRGGRRIASRAGLAESDLFPPHRAAFALLEGRPDAAELARRALADPGTRVFDTGRPIFYQLFVNLTVARGEITAARQLLVRARTEVPVFDHVLEASESSIDLTLRDLDTCRARLEGALRHARDNGVVLGTELLLHQLVQVHCKVGDLDGARDRARALDEVAATLGSARSMAYAASGRALAHSDPAAAAECLRLAQESGQAFEAAHLELNLAAAGLTDPAGLLDVYAFYGRFDALLARAWTRSVMEARGVPVPGRAVTKAENERLLGQLLTEGLTNRQIATVLGSSEKSVEGRLGRLFSRTGYRSRIELATALLDGTYAHGA
jgi:DNA-binding NarL/FixJ family response regulator